jgi:hypothetical protein
MTTLTLPTPFVAGGRFCGRPGVANGGWLAGRLAAQLPPGTTVEVTLRAPTPLDRELRLDVDDDDHQHVRLFGADAGGETLLAEARPATASPLAPSPVTWAAAARAETGFRGWWDHPFPGCFVCGHHEPGQGLRIYPGAVAERPGTVATRWLADDAEVTADGAVPTERVWAALSCPTGWVHHRRGQLLVLGRLVAKLHRAVRPGHSYVVVARADGREGHRLLSRAGLYDRDGHVVAALQATWFVQK